jgi:hypothetical protein
VTWRQQEEWLKQCRTVASFEAHEGNKVGLEKAYLWYVQAFEQLGFNVKLEFSEEAMYRPIIIAVREPRNGKSSYIGFFQHYDVEPIHKEWQYDPWGLTIDKSRVICRGIADNIGPFIHRLLVIREHQPDHGMVFVVQGEEEIGSPFADEIYPKLVLPTVSFWVEETGYFYKNGDQRILVIDEKNKLRGLIEKLQSINQRLGRGTKIRNRPLNKAFGAEKCPCLSHLIRGAPYISLGINDDYSIVHGPNESLNLDYLEISALHIQALFDYEGGAAQ